MISIKQVSPEVDMHGIHAPGGMSYYNDSNLALSCRKALRIHFVQTLRRNLVMYTKGFRLTTGGYGRGARIVLPTFTTFPRKLPSYPAVLVDAASEWTRKKVHDPCWV